MKKSVIEVLIICVAVMVLVSPVQAEMVTRDEALTVANNWTVLIVRIKGDWAGSTTPVVKEIRQFKREDRFLGYFCPVEPKGHIVVSPLKELGPVKAYSTFSDLEPEFDEGMVDVLKQGLERELNGIEKWIGSIRSAKTEELVNILGIDHRSIWSELGRDVTSFKQQFDSLSLLRNYQGGEVLLSSAWVQRPPYNKFCPDKGCTWGKPGDPYASWTQGRVGCTALAASQVMRYWAWPPYGSGSPYNDPYDWTNMPDVLNKASDTVKIDAVAELCREAGISCDADYKGPNDGCTTSANLACWWLGCRSMEDGFKEDFRYDTAIDRENRDNYSNSQAWFAMLKNEFNHNRPVTYRIPDHIIVADGWEETETEMFYHINYGWGPGEGNYLGWYLVDDIPESDPDDEFVLRNTWPADDVGSNVTGTYSLNSSFPYRYFDLDATGNSAFFEAGQMLQFLPGVTVTGSGTGGNSVRFTGSSPNKTHLFSRGDLSKGIRIDNGAIKLVNNGSAIFEPLGAPRYLRATLTGSGQVVNINWDKGHGDPYAYEIERSEGGVPYSYYTQAYYSFYYDIGVDPNTQYWYRVRAIKVGGVKSAYSNITYVKTPPL